VGQELNLTQNKYINMNNITVILNCYKRPEYLKEQIESIEIKRLSLKKYGYGTMHLKLKQKI